MSAPLEPAAGLDRSLVHGLTWSASGRWGGQVLAWASTVVVARLLSPRDYGLFAMGGVLFGLITLLNEFGLGAAIVRHHDLTADQIAQTGGLSVLFGCAGFAVTCAAAAPLAWFFRQPELYLVTLAVSLNYLVTSFRTVPLALLQRDLKFRQVAVNDFVQTAVLAGASVFFAVLGFHYWTLILASILGATISTFLAVRAAPHRLAWPRTADIGGVVRFGGSVAVSRLGAYVVANTDAVVVGRRIGNTALGDYRIASTLASLPIDKITSTVTQVMIPIFSAVQKDPPALRRFLLMVTEGLALITWPIAIGAGLLADLLVRVVLGAHWMGAIGSLRILAFAAGIRCVSPLYPPLLFVRGRSDVVMRVSIVQTVLVPVAFLIGSTWGVTGVAMGWAITVPIIVAPMLWFVLRETSLG